MQRKGQSVREKKKQNYEGMREEKKKEYRIDSRSGEGRSREKGGKGQRLE